MSLLSRAQELEDISDAQLAQLVQQGSEAGDTWLAATETQRRKDVRDRYQAEQAKQQAANPPDILTQRVQGLGGGIPSADPNMGAPPDPSLQTGIAGPPPGMASGGPIQRYQNGGEVGDPEYFIPDPRNYDRTPEEYVELVKQRKLDIAARKEGGRKAGFAAYERDDVDEWGMEEIRDGLGNPTGRFREKLTEKEWNRENPGLGTMGFMEGVKRFISSPGDLIADAADPAKAFDLVSTRPQGMTFRQALMQMGEEDEEDEATDALARRWDATIGESGRAPHVGGPSSVMPPAGAADDDADDGTDPDSIEAVLDAIGGGSGGLGSLSSVYSDMEGRVGDFQTSQRESPEDRAWDRRRLAATKRERGMAGGIHSLEQNRLAEQQRLLAKGMGISEDRIDQLMREMDTPEEVENRRKSAGYGALSSMFLNPSLAAGIGGMGEQIRDTDDILRSERKTALTEIRAERQTGFDFEDLKREGIFDLTRKSQMDYDTADIAVDNMEATILKAKADRGRAGELEAMKGYLDLLKSKAQQIGAWNSTVAQVDAQMRSATADRNNPVAQAAAWEQIEMALDDWRNRIEDKDGYEDSDEYKYYLDVVRMKDLGVASLVKSGGMALQSQDGSDSRGSVTGGKDVYQYPTGGSSSSHINVRARIPSRGPI